MEDNKQINSLKDEVANLKQQLEDLRKEKSNPKQSQQDQFIETLFDKGGDIFLEYSKLQAEKEKHNSETSNEVEKEELIIIDKLDLRDKVYKGILLCFCITSLLGAIIFIERADVIIPVISLIIGLLFKSNTVNDFFAHTNNKYKSEKND